MSRTNVYQAANATRGLSASIWDQFSPESVLSGARSGVWYDNDFVNSSVASSVIPEWVNTGVGTDTTAISATHGGELSIATGATQHNNEQHQHNGAAYISLASTDWFGMEVRCKLDDSGLAALFLGLSDTDTTILSSSALNSADHHGLFTAGADDTIAGVVENGGTAATVAALDATLGELADDTYVKLGFTVDGNGKTKFYVNGQLAGSHDGSGISTALLRPSIAVAASTAAARTLTIDRITFGAYLA